MFAIFIISILYIIYYLTVIVITSVLTGSFPDLSHTETQFHGGLFLFALGLITGIIFLMYSYPEVRSKIHNDLVVPNQSSSVFDVLLYISSEDEITILQAIKKLSPRAYKFEVAKETGLSKMKVHRITSRLEDRGIVVVEKNGRFSQIKFADWVI